MTDIMLLVEPLIPALRRYARALVRDAVLADDLVQDCLERTIAHWHERGADSDTRTWVFAILHNLVISRLRQKVRRPVDDDLGESAMTHAPATHENQWIHRDLVRALAELPEEQRSVLLLVSVEELSYADAAQVLGIPIGTVMSRLSRARDKLLRSMEGDAAPPVEHPSNLRRIK
ncbi:sigma-70 family RNA polymerase sigma factor [Pendulispora brunnea]|uniref:Sigma-70 family RNA polymerase sigma factor n=1 Tax=Pendulispora brunnea TaxID=2905690 RepID=A0ABZ2K3K7_9BACT